MSLSAPRLATVGGLTLALSLSLPGSALAHHQDGHAGGPPSDGPSAEQRPAGEERPEEQERPRETEQAQEQERAEEPKGAEGATGREADPRGNNGTVKVDGAPYDDGRGNEPHVGCEFQVDFSGFDAGDRAVVTLTGHAPTGGGTLHRGTYDISDDAAGGGQDADATLTFSVQDELSELLAVAPHPKQGWHVKLTADVVDAPGGAKSKVFWISCPAAAAAGTAGTQEETAGEAAQESATAGTTTTGTTATATREATSATTGTRAVEGLGDGAVVARDAGSAVLGTSLTRGAVAVADAEQVSADSAVLPSVLPFTGAQAVVGLLATGLAALVAGGAALRAGRRRSA